MSVRSAAPVALAAALALAACGDDQPEQAPITITAPAVQDEPKTRTAEPKPQEPAKADEPEPKVTGPSVKIRVSNGLCSPDAPAAPAGEAFTLVVRSADRAYRFTFDGSKEIDVPAHGSGRLRVPARSKDEPVLALAGEPCAVIRVGSRG